MPARVHRTGAALMRAPVLPMFDEPAHAVPQPTVQTEPARLAKAALRVLAVLQDGLWHPNHELATPECGGLRAVGRIAELRKRYPIEKRHVKSGRWEYRLVK